MPASLSEDKRNPPGRANHSWIVIREARSVGTSRTRLFGPQGQKKRVKTPKNTEKHAKKPKNTAKKRQNGAIFRPLAGNSTANRR